MDINPESSADIIHSLDDVPWPLESSTFDHVRAQDVLEHVDDFLSVVNEIYRVSRHGALVEVRMPFMSSANFATDPTHKRAATHRSFDYFDRSTELGKYHYSSARFKREDFKYIRGHVNNAVGRTFHLVDRGVLPFIEKYAATYEQYFAYIYPVHDVYFTLRVVK